MQGRHLLPGVKRGESDVLIVGAGPAGSAAGILLARAGLAVTVVDRARFPRDKTCGDALSARAITRLHSLGAMPAILRGPHARVVRSDAILPDGARIVRELSNEGLIVPRRHLDYVLRNTLADAGAEVLEGIAVRRVTANARAPTAHGDDFEWRSRVILTADGPGSVAWSAVGREPPSERALGIAATVYLEGVRSGPAPHTNEHFFERFLPTGYAWLFPAVDGACNVGVYQRVDRYKARGVALAELLERFLKRHPRRFADATRVGKVRTWQLPLARLALPPAGPGILSLGDAARLIDPLTGEGIWHALESGHLAAHALLPILQRGDCVGGATAAIARTIALRVGLPAAARRGVQLGMDTALRSGADEWRTTKALLAWGYGHQV